MPTSDYLKCRTKKILKIMGLSLLSLIVLVWLYWVFSVHDAFKEQRKWTCKNYRLVCRNLGAVPDVILTTEELKKIFTPRHEPVIDKNQKEAKL